MNSAHLAQCSRTMTSMTTTPPSTEHDKKKRAIGCLRGCLVTAAVGLFGLVSFIVLGVLITPPEDDMRRAADPLIAALDKYHASKGSYPDTIKRLIPEYLTASPSCAPGKERPLISYYTPGFDNEVGEYQLICPRFFFTRQRYSSKTKVWDTFD